MHTRGAGFRWMDGSQAKFRRNLLSSKTKSRNQKYCLILVRFDSAIENGS